MYLNLCVHLAPLRRDLKLNLRTFGTVINSPQVERLSLQNYLLHPFPSRDWQKDLVYEQLSTVIQCASIPRSQAPVYFPIEHATEGSLESGADSFGTSGWAFTGLADWPNNSIERMFLYLIPFPPP